MFGFGRRKSSAPEEDKGGKKSATGTDIDKELAKLGIFAAPVDEDDDGDLEDELLALICDDPPPSPRKPQSRSPQPQHVPVETLQPVQSPPANWSSGQVLQPTQAYAVSSPILEPTPAPPPRRPPPPQTQQSPVKTFASVPNVVVAAPDAPEEAPTIPVDLFKAPPPPNSVLEALEQRLDKYKSELNKSQDAGKTRRMGRIVKQYEGAIKTYKKGGAVDYAELPTPPGYGPIPVPVPRVASAPTTRPGQLVPGSSPATVVRPSSPRMSESPLPIQVRPKVTTSAQGVASTPPPASRPAAVPVAAVASPVAGKDADVLEPAGQPDLISDLPSDLFKAPPPPRTVLQALEQRLVKYKSEVEKANETSNTSKARRMGRIVKQYDDAISAHKKGKPVPFDELPTPPGFPPIPGQVTAPSPSLQDSLAPTGPVPTAAAGAAEVSSERPAAGSAGAVGPAIVRGGTKSGGKLTVQEKQLAVILARQKQFKSAALAAKQRGDLNQARELLRTAKGFDKLIQVSQSGLPVDMATLPAGPESVAALESEDFEVVTASDCIQPNMETGEVFVKLEEDLKEQLRICMRTRDHFKSMGDIGSANRFEHMALESKRDLDTLRLAARKGNVIPSYHYETRIFSITECNSDLGEDDLEVSVLKGINYKAGSSSDTFVKVELPYPSAEQAQINKTAVVGDAEYSSVYKLSINRSARNFHRFVHRHGVKLEVWSKGGFLRSSTLMGTATAKLLPLETKCSIHEAFDILEGRKSIGKLEVKIRVREPILTKQISQQKQKWLSIDRT